MEAATRKYAMFRLRVWMLACLTLGMLTACEKDIDISIKDNQPFLVVEGYINNVLPKYNYVILSRSLDYYSPEFQSAPVSNAIVSITSGTLTANGYNWDRGTTVHLTETGAPGLPDNFNRGVYFDQRLRSDSARALKGEPGKHYLLEIELDGKKYTATTVLLQPVPLDSLSVGYHYTDPETGNRRARVTANYQDPDTLGNRQMFFWEYEGNRGNFGWGGFASNRRSGGTDDLTNGQYIRFTQTQGFNVGDFVRFYLTSVESKVYNFWESVGRARDNEGPFATPVTIDNTITGEQVIGCFSGFSVSGRRIDIR